MTSPLGISLPHFEGPLDLLLALVRKDEIAITDIPIAQITRQYLDYLAQAEELDMDLGSDFAYMAALLIHIKSRCLLARDPEIAAREEDPRQELVRLLLDHDQVRQGAEFLRQRLELAEVSWSNPPSPAMEPGHEDSPETGEPFNLVQVLRLAQQALQAARTYDVVAPAGAVTVQEMIDWLLSRLHGAGRRVKAEPLFAEQPSAQHKAALFLAMLEMTARARIALDQPECFGPLSIALMRHDCAVT